MNQDDDAIRRTGGIRMKSGFRPILNLVSTQFGYDPRKYHAFGQEFPRGDTRRVMSRSELVEFARCPARWIRGYRDEETSAMEWGSLLDVLITQPGKFDELYAVAPKEYPGTPERKGADVVMKPWNWNAKFCQEWEKEQRAAGKEIATAPQAEKAFAAQERLQADEIMMGFMSRCRRQVFVLIEWFDAEAGIAVPFKCLMDFVPPPEDEEYGKAIGDLKTTNDASPRAWRRKVFDQGWHIQAAVYLDAINAAMYANYSQMAHLVSESKPPYETARRMLVDGPESFVQFGRHQYQDMLALYCRCLKANFWPGYDDLDSCRGGTLHGWRFVEPEVWMMNSSDEL